MNLKAYNQVNNVLAQFCDVTAKHFKSHAYAAGAMQQQLAAILEHVPEYERQAVIDVFTTLTQKYQQNA